MKDRADVARVRRAFAYCDELREELNKAERPRKPDLRSV
jgi:hypothetical protein